MKLKIKCFICIGVLVIVYLSVRSWNHAEINFPKNVKVQNKSQKLEDEDMMIEKKITLIFRYTHDSSKYLTETVNSFLFNFPEMPIIFVSESFVPREIFNGISNASNVRNVLLKLDLLNPERHKSLKSFIKTKYILISPNNVISLLPNDVLNLVTELHKSRTQLIAVPVRKKPFKCLNLKLNLIQWSMQYKLNEFGVDCDSIKGDHGLFFLSKLLFDITDPFMLPFPEAFYIQTTTMNIKIKPLLNILFYSNQKDNKKHDLQRYQIQKQIMNKQLKIKKVITESGLIEWYGCTRKTQRCFSNVVNSVPDYLNQGRWTPPCCLRVLRETVQHVFKILKNWNIRFWLEGGSLLGAVRMKDIIPWDYDVDIGIYLEDLNKCPWLKNISEQTFKKKQLPSVVDNEGFIWEKARPEEGEFYRVQASVHNRLHVDIFPFFSKNGIMTKKTWFTNHPQDKEFPEYYLQPLTTIEFAGIEAPAPNNVKEFLELKFGKGCVENPQYPNSKLFTFPDSAKHLVVNETLSYDSSLTFT